MAESDPRTPPKFTEDITYEEWKADVLVWDKFTTLAKAKRGAAVYLSFPPKSKARECVRSLNLDTIDGDGGLQIVLERLNSVYEEDENQQTFNDFKEFYSFRRQSNMNMKEFIIKYTVIICHLYYFRNYELNFIFSFKVTYI